MACICSNRRPGNQQRHTCGAAPMMKGYDTDEDEPDIGGDFVDDDGE